MTTRAATMADALSLAPRLRKSDKDTIAAIGVKPLAGLTDSLKSSDKAWSIVDDTDTPHGIFGVAKRPLPGPEWSIVWMLGTDGLTTNRIWLLRRTLVWVDRLKQMYGRIYNWEDTRNEDHIRWLKWCGFKFPGVTTTFADPSVKFTFFYSE